MRPVIATCLGGVCLRLPLVTTGDGYERSQDGGLGAKRLLFMRRVLPDRLLDRMVMRTVGLRYA